MSIVVAVLGVLAGLYLAMACVIALTALSAESRDRARRWLLPKKDGLKGVERDASAYLRLRRAQDLASR